MIVHRVSTENGKKRDFVSGPTMRGKYLSYAKHLMFSRKALDDVDADLGTLN